MHHPKAKAVHNSSKKAFQFHNISKFMGSSEHYKPGQKYGRTIWGLHSDTYICFPEQLLQVMKPTNNA